ncbi:hypothetical protein NKG94_04380 [Micromonospora sp. M12]
MRLRRLHHHARPARGHRHRPQRRLGRARPGLRNGHLRRAGATGSGGLSTISVYNSSLNKSVIYLHTAPKSAVSVGDAISKGEIIADESWHGCPPARARTPTSRSGPAGRPTRPSASATRRWTTPTRPRSGTPRATTRSRTP